MTAWVLLAAAGLAEVAMAIALKAAQGWTRFWPSVAGVVAGLGSIFLLTHAVKTLPIATAYAVWTGMGAIGVVLIDVIMFGEGMGVVRLACIAAIFGGIVGLHLLHA